jgi:hypothetical protein
VNAQDEAGPITGEFTPEEIAARLELYFTSLDDLVRRLRAAEATGRFNRQLAAYLRPGHVHPAV